MKKKMLLRYKAALTQIILWDFFFFFFESLRQKSSLARTSISAEKTGWYGERENQKAGNSRLRINARSSPRWFVFALLFLQMLDPFFSKDLRFFGSTLISCSDSICEIEEPLRDLEHITVFEVWSNFCCSPFDVERMKWGKCTVFASNSAEHM